MTTAVPAPAAVAVEGIAKKFSEFVALREISLSIGASLGAPFYRTFCRVTVPIAWPSV